MKGNLLTVMGIKFLASSTKKFYIESSNRTVSNGLYSLANDYYFHKDDCSKDYFNKSCSALNCGTIKVYEREEPKVNEYFTDEVIKMLRENEKLKFGINVGEEKCEMFVNQQGYIETKWTNHYIGIEKNIHPSDKWTSIRKLVTFIEAVNSGKRLKPFVSTGQYPDFSNYKSVSELFESFVKYLHIDGIKDLINGKWMIEDEIRLGENYEK